MLLMNIFYYISMLNLLSIAECVGCWKVYVLHLWLINEKNKKMRNNIARKLQE